eukprot:TRINITY_DN14716_c0_g1_i1.p1 TRINITY_DN14716_c0_g1~~TRINITY_DN14716_c0_g1_i1.p1  ORF type:complete len:274 (-),score=83.02 TRINITY_DN14716_c0_g1_i1:196-981(-)
MANNENVIPLSPLQQLQQQQNQQQQQFQQQQHQLHQQQLQQNQMNQLHLFWQSQMQEIDETPDFKNHQLPLARIKKIMKSDEDVKMISAEAPVLFAKACEMFILELTLRSWIHTEENKRKTLQRNDIAMAVTKTDMFDFLIDIVPRDEVKSPNKKIAEEVLGQRPAIIPPELQQYYFQMAAQQQVLQQQQQQHIDQQTMMLGQRPMGLDSLLMYQHQAAQLNNPLRYPPQLVQINVGQGGLPVQTSDNLEETDPSRDGPVF